jgi:hypothetical protein
MGPRGPPAGAEKARDPGLTGTRGARLAALVGFAPVESLGCHVDDGMNIREQRGLIRHRGGLRRELAACRERIRRRQKLGVQTQPLGWLSQAADYLEIMILIVGDMLDTLMVTFGRYICVALPIALALRGYPEAAILAAASGPMLVRHRHFNPHRLTRSPTEASPHGSLL